MCIELETRPIYHCSLMMRAVNGIIHWLSLMMTRIQHILMWVHCSWIQWRFAWPNQRIYLFCHIWHNSSPFRCRSSWFSIIQPPLVLINCHYLAMIVPWTTLIHFAPWTTPLHSIFSLQWERISLRLSLPLWSCCGGRSSGDLCPLIWCSCKHLSAISNRTYLLPFLPSILCARMTKASTMCIVSYECKCGAFSMLLCKIAMLGYHNFFAPCEWRCRSHASVYTMCMFAGYCAWPPLQKCNDITEALGLVDENTEVAQVCTSCLIVGYCV